MSNETNATIDEIMQAAGKLVQAETAYHDMPTVRGMDECIGSRTALRAMIAAALDSQARQIEALTAERDELRRRLDDANPATPATGEWIEWRGGDCPLKDNTRHLIRTRDGWWSAPDIFASEWHGWHHNDSDSDIIAYLILQ